MSSSPISIRNSNMTTLTQKQKLVILILSLHYIIAVLVLCYLHSASQSQLDKIQTDQDDINGKLNRLHGPDNLPKSQIQPHETLLDGQVFHYTIRIPVDPEEGKTNATCFVEKSGVYLKNTSCPSVMDAMISLEYQFFANWTHSYKYVEHRHQFIAGSKRFGNTTIETDFLFSSVDGNISREDVAFLINQSKNDLSFLNYAQCNVTLTAEESKNMTPVCVGSAGSWYQAMLDHPPIIEEFHRQVEMLGIQKLELSAGFRYIHQFPVGLDIVHAVRTLKDGWTMNDFVSNLMKYEGRRKTLCHCRKAFSDLNSGDNEALLAKMCSVFSQVQEQLQPFMQLEDPACFPEPEHLKQ